MSQLNFIALRYFNRTRDKEFKERMDDTEEWNIVDRSNELAGEVGEVCNVAKKLRRAKLGLHDTDKTKEDLAEELADVIICADLLAMDMDIKLSSAIAKKFNKSSVKFELDTTMPKSLEQEVV